MKMSRGEFDLALDRAVRAYGAGSSYDILSAAHAGQDAGLPAKGEVNTCCDIVEAILTAWHDQSGGGVLAAEAREKAWDYYQSL